MVPENLKADMGIIALVAVAMVLTLAVAEAQQFSVVHKYAHLEGSPATSQGQGASPEYSAMLKAHDRRRLAVVNFPLHGDSHSIGLYFTQISLGTPPRQFNVDVDTGSDILWVNCAPCKSCHKKTSIPGITLQRYDRALSSTNIVLRCTDADCAVASYGAGDGACTRVGKLQACAYEVAYGDGSSTTSGYFINDVLTFQNSTTTTTTSKVTIYFGCGTTQTGHFLSGGPQVDGILGFGQAPIAVSSQLAYKGKTSQVFAHCLQGDNTIGGGKFVIGNIQETNISYTPLMPNTDLYGVSLQNIAVKGVKITSPASFTVSASNEGVIMDSGTTLAYLVEPAYTQFVIAIMNGAPVASQQIPDGSGGTSLCWIYNGNIATTFPAVKLFFAGGVVMNLAPKNYLYAQGLSNGGSAYCMGWFSSSSITVLGDIVLKDQLVVYDNDKHRLGWKPFDCTKPITVV